MAAPFSSTEAGVGLWVRVRHRFGPRLTEWIWATIMVGVGIIFLLPSDTFALPSYAGFRQLFGAEEGIGTVMLFLGVLRLIGLIVNGARKDVTPWIRMISAGVGFMIWIGMTFAHSLSGVLGVWAVFYPMFALVELANIYRAAHDVGEGHAVS